MDTATAGVLEVELQRPLLSGLVAMAVAVGKVAISHTENGFWSAPFVHAGPTAIFLGQGEGQGPPGWVLGCASVQIFVHRQGNAG